MRKILVYFGWLFPIFTAQASVIFNPNDVPDLVEKILPSVVNISSVTLSQTRVSGLDDFFQLWGVPQERKQSSLGSGFIIDKEGHVITNYHVVAHASEVNVILQNKKSYKAKIIGKDQKIDIALLQIRDENGKPLPDLKVAPLADSDKVRIAEPVLAIGNPFGLQHTVTSGIISAKNRTIGIGPFDNFLQTDASINPGNSGGPLFNLKGEVVGINTVIFSRTQQSAGLGFAIPSNAAKNILTDLKRFGRVPRPWLGILGEKNTPQFASYYELPRPDGIIIYNLVQGGPADKAGLRRGDILIKVGEIKADEMNDVEKELAKLKPTGTLPLTIQRGNKTLTLSVKLKEFPPKIEDLPQGIL